MKHFDVSFVLRASAGLFLAALGILELDGYYGFLQSVGGGSLPFGSQAEILNTIAAVIELVAGVLLIFSLFSAVRGSTYRAVMLAVFIVWIGRIVYQYLFSGIFEPDFLLWIRGISLDALIASVLWLLYGGRAA